MINQMKIPLIILVLSRDIYSGAVVRVNDGLAMKTEANKISKNGVIMTTANFNYSLTFSLIFYKNPP